MKNIALILLTVAMPALLHAQSPTNDFYDDAPTYFLSGPTMIEVAGEIENPGFINLSDFPMHSVIVKEAELTGTGNKFIGAYRYDGISLYDILDYFILNKDNEDEFAPIIDLYVEIENEAGEKTILSWGELYYPVHHDEILIATQVARIVPSKTKDLWPLPQQTKLVVASDLITERNIVNPSKITIRSADMTFDVEKGMSPMFAPEITVYDNEKQVQEISELPEDLCNITYETTFYGRGRGIHSTTPFTGVMIKEMLANDFNLTPESISKGYFIVAAKDGYRAVFTFSEVMNRNDQSELLLIDEGDTDGGKFRLFPAFDFFSDRAIKSVKGVYYKELE